MPTHEQLIRAWSAWLDRHCSLKGHAPHLRRQCHEATLVALGACADWKYPED